MRLMDMQEVVGVLSEISQSERYLLLRFTLEEEIELPLESFDETLLKVLLGKKIRLMNYGSEFKIRIIENKKEA